ncbi:MAG TPA: GNAT family N-acetyltransferase [Anaerolineales bacterium]|nr:GNAT family N-acetyltransferase [Anaerolineales bacterium]
MTLILQTKRLLLRHQVIEDLDDLWALYCNPKITKYIPDAPRSREEAKEELEGHMHGHPKHPELGLWATIHKETGRFIGRCGLLPWTIDGQYDVEVAYTIAQEYWGQGLATEGALGIRDYAFDKLRLVRLICLIDPENIASQRVAEKMGMTLEKTVDGFEGDNLPFYIFSINMQE